MKRESVVGSKFGRLTVLEMIPPKPGRRDSRCLCLCECGNKKEFQVYSIKDGNTKSCGCFRVEHSTAMLTVHGGYGTAEYKTWTAMKRRCLDPSDVGFYLYGGRGVKIHQSWINSFSEFLTCVGKRPTSKHTIDRIDTNGNYEPGNVKWSTPKEQGRNRRNNRIIECRGQRKTLVEWSEQIGIPAINISTRIDRYGWSIEEALNFKVRAL